MRILLCGLAALAVVLLSVFVSGENCEDHTVIDTQCNQTVCATDFHLDCFSHTCTCFRNDTGCGSDHECDQQHPGGCHHGHNHHFWRCSGGKCHCVNEHN